MASSLTRFLLAYLIVSIIIYIIIILLYYYYFDLPIANTTDRAMRTAADVDLTLKAACATIVHNANQPTTNIVKSLYPPESLGVTRCREILASS